MEATEYGLYKAIGLNTRPVVYLVGGNVLYVAGYVLRCIRIATYGADSGHKFVVLVGDGYKRSLVAYRVYLMIDGGAFGAVCGLAIYLKKVFDLVKQWLLALVVRSSEVGGTLKHQVFKIVSQAGSLGRVILPAYTHRYVCLDTRLVLIDRHVQAQAVWQRVHQRLGRVVGYRLVLIAVCRCSENGQYRHGHDNQMFNEKSHNVNVVLVYSMASGEFPD